MNQKKQEAFIELYTPVHERFERFCRARVYGDMEHGDLINETLLAAFERFDSLRSKEAFLGFLFGTAVRILAKNHRKVQHHVRMETTTLQIPSPSAGGEEQADVHFLFEAMRHLNEAQRESLILFEISGFSIREIAGIQEVSEDAVKQRLKRGRERLAELLGCNQSVKKGGQYAAR